MKTKIIDIAGLAIQKKEVRIQRAKEECNELSDSQIGSLFISFLVRPQALI